MKRCPICKTWYFDFEVLGDCCTYCEARKQSLEPWLETDSKVVPAELLGASEGDRQ